MKKNNLSHNINDANIHKIIEDAIRSEDFIYGLTLLDHPNVKNMPKNSIGWLLQITASKPTSSEAFTTRLYNHPKVAKLTIFQIQTIFLWAAKYGNEILINLMQPGLAQPNMHKLYIGKAIEAAIENNHHHIAKKIIRPFRTHYYDPNWLCASLTHLTKQGNFELTDILLQHPSILRARHFVFLSAIDTAIQKYDTPLVWLLSRFVKKYSHNLLGVMKLNNKEKTNIQLTLQKASKYLTQRQDQLTILLKPYLESHDLSLLTTSFLDPDTKHTSKQSCQQQFSFFKTTMQQLANKFKQETHETPTCHIL